MPRDTGVAIEIARLRDLNHEDLRLRWRNAFGKIAPSTLQKSLLLRLFAYRLQAQLHGDISPATTKLLDTISRSNAAGSKVPIIEAVNDHQGQMQPGTVLVREHDGASHHVTVLEKGFSWNGQTFASLTKVAHAITGTNWNGPRFFGLRDRQASK
jgi:hypothetical protein